MIKIFSNDVDATIWDDFVMGHADDGGLLQSWKWGKFQQGLGRKIWRLGVLNDGKLAQASLIIKQPLKLGWSFFYTPRGPAGVLTDKIQFEKNFCTIWREILDLAQPDRPIFWRVEPAWTTVQINPDFFLNQGFVSSKANLQPKTTLYLDLALEPSALLNQMKSKTRYNIGLASRKGVLVKTAQRPGDVRTFYEILEKTTSRQKFRTHPYEYFEKMVQVFNGGVKLYFAFWDSRVIGAILVAHAGGVASYLHGGMDDNYRHLMAPYLLHWTAILEAKAAGLKKYDFWGVQTDNDHADWEGFTRFKTSFAPTTSITEYLGTFDKVFNQKIYDLYRWWKK